MVHTHAHGPKCPRCGSSHVDADQSGKKLKHYCLECGWQEK